LRERERERSFLGLRERERFLTILFWGERERDFYLFWGLMAKHG